MSFLPLLLWSLTMSLFRPLPTTGTLPKVVAFDLDKTLIGGDATILWTEFLYETGIVTDPIYREINRKMVERYHAGTLDIAAWLKEAVPAYASLEAEARDQLVDRFVDEKIEPLVYPEGVKRIQAAKAEGRLTVIISASNAFFVKPLAAKLFGVDIALGCNLVMKDGRVTPILEGAPTFKEGKITRLREALSARGLTLEETVFFTDSRNDLPLAFATGDCEVVNPDPKLKATALEKGWRIHTWKANC